MKVQSKDDIIYRLMIALKRETILEIKSYLKNDKRSTYKKTRRRYC